MKAPIKSTGGGSRLIGAKKWTSMIFNAQVFLYWYLLDKVFPINLFDLRQLSFIGFLSVYSYKN